MRRQWIGVGLLLAVLILGIVLTTAFDRIHRPLADKLEAASQAALAEDWTQADTADSGRALGRENGDALGRPRPGSQTISRSTDRR